MTDCPNCNGRGYGDFADYDGWYEEDCRDCDGTGQVPPPCHVDGCNHGDCEAAARDERRREIAEDNAVDAYIDARRWC